MGERDLARFGFGSDRVRYWAVSHDATSFVPARVAVLGAGSWGTALAIHMSRLGHDVLLYARSEAHADAMRRDGENQRYLLGCRFPTGLRVTHHVRETTVSTEVIVLAVPSHAMRGLLHTIRVALGEGARRSEPLYLIAAKGVEVDTLQTMDALVHAELAVPSERVSVLGGPSFAAEVAAGQPTAVVVAARDPHIAARIQRLLSGARFRAYVTDDVRGVELGGACKNVIALAAGVGDGAGFGQNARAALITRGLAEMSRLAVALGGRQETLAGLAGLGDLVLTCTGALSRNRRVGVALGKGQGLEAILASMGMVAEGVRNTRSVFQLGQRADVELPIVETMNEVLYEGLSVETAVHSLMKRSLKGERG
ncbi:MAG: NAD(P)H-dependent glycerol-3-phosphate dehydrogenase [Nannocystaceae bacterium]